MLCAGIAVPINVSYILLVMVLGAVRSLGTRLGSWLSGIDTTTRHWIGLSLLPQAGVAIGMALLASQRFPEIKNIILPVVLGSTMIFGTAQPRGYTLDIKMGWRYLFGVSP